MQLKKILPNSGILDLCGISNNVQYALLINSVFEF